MMAQAALSLAEFRNLCRDNQFADLGVRVNEFVDLLFPKVRIKAVLIGKARDLDATWKALLAHRAKAEGAKRDRDAQAAIVRTAVDLPGLPMLNAPRPVLEGAFAVRLMAEDIRDAAARGSSVTEDDLYPLGWTQAQLTELGPLARRTAQALAGAV